MSSSNSLKIKNSPSRVTILGVPINTLGGHKLRIGDNDYESTLEKNEALPYTGYTGETMKNQNDILMMKNNIRDLDYTGTGDTDSRRKTFFTIILPKLIEEVRNKTFDEIKDDSDDLQGEGVKLIELSKIIEIYTRLEVLLGLKLSGQNDTLTETSNLID